MASCPALSNENGSLIFSTTDTADGTVVVIGCSGFGRHKTEPINVFCSNGVWSPTPTTGCETGFDNREVLIIGVSAGCAFLALVVLILLCCSCCFYRRRLKRYRWWRRRHSGDERIFVNGGIDRYSHYSHPQKTIISRHGTIVKDYGNSRSQRSIGRTNGYSHFERWRESSKPGRTEVYTREAFIPDYDFFGTESRKGITSKSFERSEHFQARRNSAEFMGRPLEFTRTRRYSAGSGAEMMRRSQYSTGGRADMMHSRRYSAGSRADMMRRSQYSTGNRAEMMRRSQFSTGNRADVMHRSEYSTGSRADMMRGSQYSMSRHGGSVIIPSSDVEYHYSRIQPAEQRVEVVEQVEQPKIETIQAPAVETFVNYAEQPVNVEYVEQRVQYVDTPIDYSTPFYTAHHSGSYILTNGMFRGGYTNLGSSVTSLPRAKITELPDDAVVETMKVVPYKSISGKADGESLDPSIYFTGRQDYNGGSWRA